MFFLSYRAINWHGSDDEHRRAALMARPCVRCRELRKPQASCGKALVSRDSSREADSVTIRGTDDEVLSAPSLLRELLTKARALLDVLGIKRFHVLGLDEGIDESILVRNADNEHWLVYEFDMQT